MDEDWKGLGLQSKRGNFFRGVIIFNSFLGKI